MSFRRTLLFMSILIAILLSVHIKVPFKSIDGKDLPTRADPTIDGTIGLSEYEDSINIDEGKFELFWTTTGSTIFIGMRAEVTGWISLGLDPVNVMTNSDMIFGGVDAGTPYIYDAWCTNDVGNHPEDTTFTGGSFDIDEYDATESAGSTTVEFRRAMSTGDPYDKKFVNGTSIKIMWATHNDSDDWTDEHDDAGYSTITMDGTPPPPPPVSSEFDGVITDGEYSNSTTFDGGNFQLFWKVNETNITIGMKVLATGWVSLGISPTSMMLGADFLMGGFDGSMAYAEDHYATTTTAHVLDTDLAGGTDDIDAFNATESGGWTHLELRRALVTGDPNDKDIIIGTMNIIWGYSTSDNIAAKHTKVGYGTWRVDAAPPPPPPPPPKSDFDGIISSGEYGNVTKTDSDRFEVHWKVNGSSIDVAIRAQATGYVSIGIDPTVQMKDADMIFGWVTGGKAGSEDHFGSGFTTHMRDEDLGGTYDIISYNGTEAGGWTTFEFRRNLTTPDIYDRAIRTDEAFPLIWAVADTDDPTATHSRRGTIMWNLSNETGPPPPPPLHVSDLDGIISEGEYKGSKMYDSDRIELHWNISGAEIVMGIRAQTTGWISLGIDPTNMMEGADYVIGGIDGTTPYAEDHYGNTVQNHARDIDLGGTDDILDYNSTQQGGWTTLEYRRNLSASDAYDNEVRTNGTMTVIWAYSDSDDPTAKHTRTLSGTWSLNATTPPPPPPPPRNTTLDGIVSSDEYDDSASFGGGSFEVHWTVNGSRIWMALVAQTTGWVSIGFEPSVAMKDADMVFGWVEADLAKTEDHWGTGMTTHARDEELGGSYDLFSFNGTESGGVTTIEFIRELDTGDAYDRVIPSNGSLNIIWAIGGDDDPTSTHAQRGTGTLLLYMDAPEPSTGLDGIISQGEYRDSATFDFENFKVSWTIEGEDLRMAISARTTGWVSIGFDPEDVMKDSDVILGWVEGGVVHIIDAYSMEQYGPHPPDTHLGGTTDILAYNGTEKDGSTTIEFVRRLITGDEYDKDIPTSGTLEIMWAYGEHDDFGETHSQRGFATLTIGPGGEEPLPELDGIISEGEYDFHDEFVKGLIDLHWKIRGDNFTMAIVANTPGWVSIGFGDVMSGSDMIIGCVESDGTVKVWDTYGPKGSRSHPPDTSQGGTDDILAFGGKQVGDVTTIEFVRKLDTGDDKDKVIPREGTIDVIWAYSRSDSFDSMHEDRGVGTIEIHTGKTTSSKPLALWPIHAIFMTLGTGGMIAATLVLYRRKWKFFFKFHMWVMTAATAAGAIGLITGFYMVEETTGVHLRVPHSWLGLLTLGMSLFALGVGFYFRYTKNMKHKKPSRTIHKYAGWAGAVLFLLTAISGFLQAVVFDES
ncbi:MAG: DOMON domain-containing protein, partial [Thermoplasmatota archaeon]